MQFARKSVLSICNIWQTGLTSSRSLTFKTTKPVLTMYTKEECSLCEDAKEILVPYLNRIEFKEEYITEPQNEEYFYKYRFDIPVFHLNGKYLMKHRINEELLEKSLKDIENMEDNNSN